MAALVVTVATGVLAFVVERGRPLPFATTDDSPMYMAPLVELQARALLAGHWPRMFWELGSGWTPLESGQVGLAYPGYLLAALLARAIGQPLALLDISAFLHLWAAGLACAMLLPTDVDGPRRAAWALLAVVQPGAFLLGLNWHGYLACYPWFLAMGLLLLRGLPREARWAPGAELGLVAASAGFWLTAHPQIYVLGVACLAAWSLAFGGGRGWPALLALGLAQLPLLVPTLFIQATSSAATADWMSGRGLTEFALNGSQSVATVLEGILAGNFADGGFRLWKGVPGIGQGMFFAPWLLGSWLLAARARRNAWIALSLLLVGLMAIATFPGLAYLIPPALGLRWTWKLSLFLGPLAMLTILQLREVGATSSRRAVGAALVALTLASGAVCVRGTGFDLWPGLMAAHPIGLAGIVDVTRQALGLAGVPQGARIAIVGAFRMSDEVPLPLLGLTGNTPVLSGFESAHLYEPLENAVAATSHDGLSTPWRTAVDAAAYQRDPAGVEARLASLGVRCIVTAHSETFPRAGTVEFRDPLGRTTFLRRIEGAPPSFPFDVSAGKARPLERLPGGRLRTVVPSSETPVLNLPRPITWERLEDGRWVGTPEAPTPWILFGLAAAAAALAIVATPFGRKAHAAPTPARNP